MGFAQPDTSKSVELCFIIERKAVPAGLQPDRLDAASEVPDERRRR